MSITLVTGVPGSGKTLYTVAQLLRPWIGATVDKKLDDGTIEKVKRPIYTNINGLLLEHELIEGGGTWSMAHDKSWAYVGNTQALRNWPDWAKPGSIICFDEFQKFWPPRPNGAPIPPDLQTLDTHRHMGVDFILVTQNCMNVDRHILGLVDRHLHIRRVSNMPLAVVYEWDHASKSLLYKNAITKSPWRFDKSVYKLYKSAELHTKQRRKLPGLLWFVLAGMAGAAYAVPSLVDRISNKVKPPVTAPAPEAPAPAIDKKVTFSDGKKYITTTATMPLAASSQPTAPAPLQLAPMPAMGASSPLAPDQIAGCVQTAHKCACTNSQGRTLPTDPGQCEAHILGNAAPGQKADTQNLYPETGPAKLSPADKSVMTFMANGRKSTGGDFDLSGQKIAQN